MKFQREPSTCFGPSRRSAIKKKSLGPRMIQINQDVRRSQTYMSLSGASRNNAANRRDDIENIACVRNSKYDSSKSGHANQGRDNVVVKSWKHPFGDNNIGMPNEIFPLGKSKKLVVSPSSMDVQKSMPSSSSLRFDLAFQTLEDTSGDANRISKEPLHSNKEIASSRGLKSALKATLIRDKVKVASTQGVIGRKVHFADEHQKEQTFKENEHNNSCTKSKCNLGKKDLRDNPSVRRRRNTSHMGGNMKMNEGLAIEDCRTDKIKSKRKGLPEENANAIEESKTVRPVKRRRSYIPNVHESDDDDDQNVAGVEDGSNGLTTQTAIMQQYGSLPIDDAIWSGMLKIGSEDYVSLEAHLLAKSSEKVWECSRSLQNMIQVTELSRLEAEPKCFRVSRPTEENIGLYFFPQGMRPNEDFDKLVKKVMDNDLILRAYVGEAEMLMFPSILLPERHQTFQGKHYLWALFKRIEDKVNVEGEEHMCGTPLCGHDKENVRECSCPRVDKSDIDMERGALSLARPSASTPPAEHAVAEAAAPASAAVTAMAHAPSHQAEQAPPAPAPAATSHATSSTCPAVQAATEATAPAPAATDCVYGFIARPSPKIQQLIQLMGKEGAVVFAMRGETIGFGLGSQ